MDSKIKTIKEFLSNGPPQFDIILRRDKGRVVTISLPSSLFSNSKQETIFSPESGNGIIQIVKRISDDKIFHQFLFVNSKSIGTCFILEFSEDLIHCVVIGISGKEDFKKTVEINDLELLPEN